MRATYELAMNNGLRFLIVAVVFSSCAKPEMASLEVKTQYLIVGATVTVHASKVHDDLVRLSGTVGVRNTSSEIQEYSNAWLWLRVDENHRARTWLGNIGSHGIDVGPIEIMAHDEFSVPAYWVFPNTAIASLDADTMSLEFDAGD